MNFLFEFKNFFTKKNVLNFDKTSFVHANNRGIPTPTKEMEKGCGACRECETNCPTSAIKRSGESVLNIDYGKCLQCGNCVEVCPEGKLRNSGFIYTFTLHREEFYTSYKNGKLQKNTLSNFTLTENQKRFRALTHKRGFLYREVAAGGNNTVESELNASFNSVFDSEREGIRCVASPKHADAIVFSGPVSSNMEMPLQVAWDVMSEPKALIACGTEAVSGGLFPKGKIPKEPDLYISGDPPRPDVILQGFRLLLGRFSFQFQEALHKFLESEK
ncbi:MAG: 4Fe-4S dicluster domain-containing protein [Leptospira bouyouniensis]|uniref:4Fe-4S dicluster domain-containing protein n=1 Tax=Leptospira bouyouniensis TaxID=2484911 RepID=A0A7I0IMU8_9LEPT|nr:4Fe-4S dicluster domain-containing protein [Leptospira bouyouniensis]TGK52409.1 4Fe-4S dicluster domain-containing protein [Leptospira bouyouniensis]TGL04790.1 4Fe-4S dicluster domain-containing protein [Leptospira bouyouniensis]